MTSILEAFERDLVRVAANGVSEAEAPADRRTPLRHHSRRILRALPVLALVAICVVIGVVAIVSLHGRPQGRTTTPEGASSVSGREALLSAFAILRAPQTAADRAELTVPSLPGLFRLQPVICRGKREKSLPLCALRLQRSLVREVDLPGRLVAGIFPDRLISVKSPAGDGEGVVISLRGAGIEFANTLNGGVTPSYDDSVAAAIAHGLMLSASTHPGVNRGVILVPDGVASVSLSSFRIPTQPRARTASISALLAAAHHNFVAFWLSGLTPHQLGLDLGPAIVNRYGLQSSQASCGAPVHVIYRVPATAEMRWYGSRRDLISRQRIRMTLYVATVTRHPPHEAVRCRRSPAGG